MTRQTGPSKVIQAVSATAGHSATFYVGLGLLGVWVLFMGATLAVNLFTAREASLPLWAHAPAVLGASLAAPKSLAAIGSFWKDVRK